MPATRYKIWSKGSPVGKGATKSFHVGVAGISKSSTKQHKYLLVNELICQKLAQVLLLPVPPGFIIADDDDDGEPYFTSLNFNLAGEELPPVDPKKVIEKQLSIATGIIVFDIWILNNDRHRNNLAYYEEKDKVMLFDHSHAFLSRSDDAKKKLDDSKGKFYLNSHCLAKVIHDSKYIDHWINRIRAIPNYYVKEVVKSTVSLGLEQEYQDQCVKFILERSENLSNLINSNQDFFPNIQQLNLPLPSDSN